MLSRYSTDFSFRNIILILFFLSGVTSIVYLLLGIRFFLIYLGNTLSSHSILISSFLLGIIIGVFRAGRYIDKNWYELKNFMYSEFITGAYAVALFLSLHYFPLIYSHIFIHLLNNPALLLTVNFALCFLLLLPLTFLIGAKFSILGRYLIRSDKVIAREIGMLHSSHVLGASLGCLFVLVCIYTIGAKLAVLIIPVLNFLNSLSVKILLEKFAHPQKAVSEFYDQQLKHFSSQNENVTSFQKNFILAVNGLTSFIIIAHAILVFRQLIYLSIGNFFINGMVLSAILLSTALGSYTIAKLDKESRHLIFKTFVLHVAVSILFLLVVVYQPKIIIFNQKLWLQQYPHLSYFSFLDIMLLLLFPFIALGMSFSIMFKIFLVKFDEIGTKVGRFYSIYFLGFLIGIVSTIYFLIPKLGSEKSILLLSTLSFIITVILLVNKGNTSVLIKIVYTLVMGAIITAFYWFYPDFFVMRPDKNEKIIQTKGSHTVISVNVNTINNEIFLKANGRTITGTSLYYDISHKLLAHLPMLLHENPKEIFICGYGYGKIPKFVSKHNIERIDCLEAFPDVVELSDYFQDDNDTLAVNMSMNLYFNDAYSYIGLTDRKYDVMIINYLHPELYKNFVFYDREFFNACRNHLNAGGIIAVSVPLFNFSINKLKAIVNTLYVNFKHISLWFNNNNQNYNLILIASKNENLKFNFTTLSEKLSNADVRHDLATVGLNDIYEILNCFILGPTGLFHIKDNFIINTFNQPNFAFTVETEEDRTFSYIHYLQFMNKWKEPIYDLLTDIETSGTAEETAAAILENYDKGSTYVMDGLLYEFDNDVIQALKMYRLAFKANNRENGANRFLNAYYDHQLIPNPQTPDQLTENAKIFYQKMNYQKAIELFNEAIKLDSNYAPAYFGLGINYEVLNDFETAKKMYQKTLRLKPNLEQAKLRLDNILKQEQEMKDKVKRGLLIR